jgi:L-ascorbate metabolism protein UlaG (beta-lactamase superfamily)
MRGKENFYLRQNIQFEPLVDQWYAWPHLIPPATSARNLTERHLKIMDSYISFPELHASAVKNPKLLGGPFIDYGEQRVEEIRQLRDTTITEQAKLIELSSALDELDRLLGHEAKGYSLEPLYARVPESLRGYVELTYDLQLHPSFRLIEPLLYKSSYYDLFRQSLMLSVTKDDSRPFVLSTPRLSGNDSIHLQRPFNDDIFDFLANLKSEFKSWAEIKEALPIPDSQDSLLRSFLTSEQPPPYASYEGGGMRWRYFGHACILIEANGRSLLFDPVLSYTYESDISRYTYLDLPERIDYVLITHNHQDHVLLETLLQIRHKTGAVVVPRSGGGALQDPSLKLILENCGFKNVIEMSEMEEICDSGVRIRALPFLGEHGDLAILTKMAWLVTIGCHSLLFAADSCNVDPHLYQHVHREVGDVDALFLGMECDGAPMSWLYGPLMTQKPERGMDQSRRLAGSNFEQAMNIVDLFHCREAYVYAMGQEPWLNYVMSIKYTAQSRPIIESNRLIDACLRKGIVAERLFGEKEILLESAVMPK